MKHIIFAAGAILALLACGGGGSSPEPEQEATGIVAIAMTDAAVDYVNVVNVRFTGVTLKPQSGDMLTFEFSEAKDIDLLALQDGRTEELLPGTRVPVGRYNWIRLAVQAEFDNVFDSYTMLNDGT